MEKMGERQTILLDVVVRMLKRMYDVKKGLADQGGGWSGRRQTKSAVVMKSIGWGAQVGARVLDMEVQPRLPEVRQARWIGFACRSVRKAHSRATSLPSGLAGDAGKYWQYRQGGQGGGG